MTTLSPIIMVAAPSSRQGKTLITASLARLYQRQGYRVRVFKVGPDFLDPKIHRQASKQRSDNLDLWLMGENYCRTQLKQARQCNDLVLVESVMGLFDHEPSNADFAIKFNLPILLLIDSSSMGASFAAIAYGITNFCPDLNFLGIIANRIGSKNHKQLIQKNLSKEATFLGAIPRDVRLQLPERHLGLYQPEEFEKFDAYLDAAADVLYESGIKLPVSLAKKSFVSSTSQKSINRPRVTIAIARDKAFNFIYQSNLEVLQSLNCNTIFFSPLSDKFLPDCDAIWLTGGYPELFAKELSANTSMKQSISQHVDKDKPVYAECGGMLYLFETLKTKQGESYKMCGLLKGKVTMENKFQGIGLQELTVFEETIRGHSFHHARVETNLQSLQLSQHQRQNSYGEAFYSDKSIYASFLHLWFTGSEKIIRKLFRIE